MIEDEDDGADKGTKGYYVDWIGRCREPGQEWIECHAVAPNHDEARRIALQAQAMDGHCITIRRRERCARPR